MAQSTARLFEQNAQASRGPPAAGLDPEAALVRCGSAAPNGGTGGNTTTCAATVSPRRSGISSIMLVVGDTIVELPSPSSLISIPIEEPTALPRCRGPSHSASPGKCRRQVTPNSRWFAAQHREQAPRLQSAARVFAQNAQVPREIAAAELELEASLARCGSAALKKGAGGRPNTWTIAVSLRRASTSSMAGLGDATVAELPSSSSLISSPIELPTPLPRCRGPHHSASPAKCLKHVTPRSRWFAPQHRAQAPRAQSAARVFEQNAQVPRGPAAAGPDPDAAPVRCGSAPPNGSAGGKPNTSD